MHPNNPFAADYDFDRLVQEYPNLEPFVFVNQYGNQTIKFGDKQAVKALNAALLKTYYEINWDIPDNNLCPPVPGRLDYLLHIAELFPQKHLRLLDIGTGASLIYPILATCHFQWNCTASETNRDSLENAQKIIDQNPPLHAIELRRQTSKHKILDQIIRREDEFDVVICNPPFFKNRQEAEKSNQRKFRNLKLKTANTRNFGGLADELWYDGGEVAFIKKMVSESRLFRKQVYWFTGERMMSLGIEYFIKSNLAVRAEYTASKHVEYRNEMSMNFHHLKIHQPQMIKIYAKTEWLHLCRNFAIALFSEKRT